MLKVYLTLALRSSRLISWCYPPCAARWTFCSRKVIREDFTIEAYDILELHCELVAERMRLVASQKDAPPDMEQAICTLIWAADRAEVRAAHPAQGWVVLSYI